MLVYVMVNIGPKVETENLQKFHVNALNFTSKNRLGYVKINQSNSLIIAHFYKYLFRYCFYLVFGIAFIIWILFSL